MKIYLWNDRTATIIDDKKNTVSFVPETPEFSGILRLNGESCLLREGCEEPSFGSVGFVSGVFTSNAGTKYSLKNVIITSGKPCSKLAGNEEFLNIKEKCDRLEDLIYKMKKELGQMKATRFYDSKGIFHNTERSQNNEK